MTITIAKYTFEFKITYSEEKTSIEFESQITIKEFVEQASIKIREIFPDINFASLDIVEAGQYNNSNGRNPELADRIDLVYNIDSTLEDIFGNRWKNTAFYIRIL